MNCWWFLKRKMTVNSHLNIFIHRNELKSMSLLKNEMHDHTMLFTTDWTWNQSKTKWILKRKQLYSLFRKKKSVYEKWLCQTSIIDTCITKTWWRKGVLNLQIKIKTLILMWCKKVMNPHLRINVINLLFKKISWDFLLVGKMNANRIVHLIQSRASRRQSVGTLQKQSIFIQNGAGNYVIILHSTSAMLVRCYILV